MTSSVKVKIAILVGLTSLGLFLRWGLGQWVPETDAEEAALASRTSTLSFSKKGLGSSQGVVKTCLDLESKNQSKANEEQQQFLKATASAYCYCIGVQLEKSDWYATSFVDFLKSDRGQKISHYCHQVAKFEIHRKTGRAVSSWPPPLQRKTN